LAGRNLLDGGLITALHDLVFADVHLILGGLV
jgi:hypothetical protein